MRCLRGSKHEQWRRLAMYLNPIDDVTGDGIADAYHTLQIGLYEQLAIISGADGRLWQSGPELQGDPRPLIWEDGSPDLNGDGDTLDKVVHVTDLDTGVTTNLGLAGLDPHEWFVSDKPTVEVRGDSLAFLVSESSQGEVDFSE